MAHTIVIFGASGDLTSRKLIPALYRLFNRGQLPTDTKIVGVSRTEFSDEAWREQLGSSAEDFLKREFSVDCWNRFADCIHYCPGDIKQDKDFVELAKRLDELEEGRSTARVYYVATMPQLYAAVAEQLGKAGLADERRGARRIVIEKPFGTDLNSAHQLNQQINRVFREDQVYRIDHYLGKETVQNILVLRFGNAIFEPLWNRNYIDRVEITVAEEVTVGRRGEYYDRAGILRDMFQNHLFQLMMVIAMESPIKFNSDSVRDEKVKVLRAIRPFEGADFAECGVRGQYQGYAAEDGVAPQSQTETFAALRLHIDNWRWNGVPFYLRSGKGLSCRTTQIVITFREPPHLIFGDRDMSGSQPNRLVIQIQPAEGIQLHFQSKVPEQEMSMRQSELDFRFDRTGVQLPDAYQRLLQDAILGDASLFARSDEVELAWAIVDPIIEAWRSPAAPKLYTYELGGWGPAASSKWMEKQGRAWFDVCPVIH